MESFVKDYNKSRIREIEQNAYNIGRAAVLQEHIKSLVEKQKFSLDEACNAVGISVQEYKNVEEILTNERIHVQN